MILTTNRATVIDAAFESRIDLTIGYEDLSQRSREQIWRGFVKKIEIASEITEENIQALASIPLNGRQIKSAVKTARVLAAGEKVKVTMDHLSTVIRLRQRAAQVLSGTGNKDTKRLEKAGIS
jgi:AAA+ superfamily predicted ATPase